MVPGALRRTTQERRAGYFGAHDTPRMRPPQTAGPTAETGERTQAVEGPHRGNRSQERERSS